MILLNCNKRREIEHFGTNTDFCMAKKQQVQELKALAFFVITVNDEQTKPTFKRKLRIKLRTAYALYCVSSSGLKATIIL